MTTMHQSNVEEIFKFIDALVFAKMGKHMSDVQRLLIQTAWFKPGQRYDDIAQETGYSATYLKKDAGPNLWRLLSDILGEKIKKSNFRAAMERRASFLPLFSSPAATALLSSSLPTPSCQLADVAASCPINTRPNSPVAFVDIKCVTPMTFSQKLYQSHGQEIAEEFEQAIEANSLEKMNELFDKVLE